MNENPKNNDEIIELTDVVDEDQLEEDLDQELKDFLADADEDDFQSPGASRKEASDDLPSDLDSFFDREETEEEMDEEWTLPRDQEEGVADFTEADLEMDPEDPEETAEFENMFSDLEEQQDSTQREPPFDQQLKATNHRIKDLANEVRDLQARLEALPPAASLSSLVEKEAQPVEPGLSREAEAASLEQVGELIEKKVEAETRVIQQDLVKRLEQLEYRISGISEQVEALETDRQTLKQNLLKKDDFNDLKDGLWQDLEAEIRKTVPRAAAEIIREEIRRMREDS